jgi:AmmeMemoRadiSam system protein A
MSNIEPSASLPSPQRLLALARVAARRHLGDRQCRLPERWPEAPFPCGGLFVTYWSRDVLRGCIGTFGTTPNLWELVPEVAAAALVDPRFADRPVTATELPSLRIEISVLSDLARTGDPLAALVPGTHGVMIRRDDRSGCFLPKVAEQRGWTAEDLLRNCCTMKAGLPPDAWRDASTEVYLFTAESVAEGES